MIFIHNHIIKVNNKICPFIMLYKSLKYLNKFNNNIEKKI